jgi:cytochrome c551/c552
MLRTVIVAVALSGLALSALASTARADAAAGDACAANLKPDGKLVYAAVVAVGPTLENLRSKIEEQARSLVMGGKIARGEARDNATAAGECVRARLQ